MNKKIVVKSPVVDLRKEPSESLNVYFKDPLQESQLLYGEKLFCHEEQGDWLFVEAIEQKKFIQGKWQGYPGWIKRETATPVDEFLKTNLIVQIPWAIIFKEPQEDSPELRAVCFGTKLLGLEERGEWWILKLLDGEKGAIQKEAVTPRKSMIELGKMFLNAPYHWGGRSAFFPDQNTPLTSMDCSGFSNLLYRARGIDIPRDAHDQYLASQKIQCSELKEGDLIFSRSASKPDRIDHVLLFVSQDRMMEATMQANCIRLVTAEEKFGHSLENTPNIAFGRYDRLNFVLLTQVFQL